MIKYLVNFEDQLNFKCLYFYLMIFDKILVRLEETISTNR